MEDVGFEPWRDAAAKEASSARDVQADTDGLGALPRPGAGAAAEARAGRARLRRLGVDRPTSRLGSNKLAIAITHCD